MQKFNFAQLPTNQGYCTITNKPTGRLSEPPLTSILTQTPLSTQQSTWSKLITIETSVRQAAISTMPYKPPLTQFLHPVETKEPLSTTIPTIADTHVLSSLPTFLSSTLYSTLSTAKHEMDLLFKDITPPILPLLENCTLFQEHRLLCTVMSHHGTKVFHTSLKAEVLACQFEQFHHLTLNMRLNNHALVVTRYDNRLFRNTPLRPLNKSSNP
jgi:hypothetical protein